MKTLRMNYFLIYPLFFFSFSIMAQADQPTTDWGNLNKYAAANKNLKPPSPGENRIVFMGNSITESWLSIDSAFFAHKPYVNRGIGGQTSPQMLIRFRQDVIDLKPAVVVILAGINDIAENTGHITQEQTFGNIVSMAELAKVNHIRVVLCSVLPAFDFPWRPGLEPVEKITRLNSMIKAYCTKEKIVYVDYYSAMVDEQKGLDKRYTVDGVHPTLAGYKVMEPILEAGIGKALLGKQ